MGNTSTTTIETLLEEIRDQLRALTSRVEHLEQGHPAAAAPVMEESRPVEPAAIQSPPVESAPLLPEPIPEEDLLAISAALAAYFGVRVHARQIRLIGSSAWAQQGRVSIQASHRLVY